MLEKIKRVNDFLNWLLPNWLNLVIGSLWTILGIVGMYHKIDDSGWLFLWGLFALLVYILIAIGEARNGKN